MWRTGQFPGRRYVEEGCNDKSRIGCTTSQPMPYGFLICKRLFKPFGFENVMRLEI